MPLPTETAILADIAQIKQYKNLYDRGNGSLSDEARLAISLNATPNGSGGGAALPSFLPTSALSQVKEANDFQQILAYLDAGLADERLSTVKYRSVALASEYTDTFTYAGVAGNYRLTNLVRTFASI